MLRTTDPREYVTNALLYDGTPFASGLSAPVTKTNSPSTFTS